MILVVVGTRPELLKMAPVVKLAKARGLPIHVHCTMQSPDLVDRGILPWDSQGENHWPDIGARFVVVCGDTRTAYQWAIRAFENQVPVFHLESGVRTGNLAAPFPEEAYRRMIDVVATWGSCNTFANLSHLDVEGPYRGDRFRITGSPIVESVRERSRQQPSTAISPYAVVTLHRRENRGHFADILWGIQDGLPLDHKVLWMTHPNGWARGECPSELESIFTIVPPRAPDAFAATLSHASLVITDSGGAQEESNALKVRCIVARTVTDRPESLGPKGGAILGGNTRESIATAIQEALKLDRSQIDPTIFGDGKASERIVEWWTQILEGKC